MIELSDIPVITGSASLFGLFMWFLKYQNGLIDRSDGRVWTLEQRITNLEDDLRGARRAEQVCLTNQAILRRALIQSGIDIPPLADVPEYHQE